MDAPTCWVVSNGNPGMESQCLGLAEALGLVPEIKHVALRSPWKQLSPSLLRVGNRWALSPASDRLDGPPPDLLIATGRHSVAPSLALGRRSGGKTFRVQIQDPAIDPGHFDLVVVPRHDRLRGDNVVLTKGALTRVTAERLAAAGRQFADRLAALPHPRLAVLVGGTNGAYRLTEAIAERLAGQLATLLDREGGALMITASRRTDEGPAAILRARLAALPGELWDGNGANPYFAYLDQADAILVTADSVNMVSEACATGKPVHVIELDGGSAKFDRFHQGLQADGMTRPFDGSLAWWRYAPLDDTRQVAGLVRRRLAERGLAL